MNLKALVSFFLLSVAVVLSVQAETSEPPQKNEKPDEITLGIIRGGSPDLVKEQAVLLAKELQERLSTPIQLYFPKNYSGLKEAMKNGKVQFGFYTALSFVEAEKDIALKALLKKTWSGPFYYSAVITNDPKIKKISDLKGKRVAFVDESSTSGYLYPLVMLRKNGLDITDFSQVLWSGNHENSIHLLHDKKVSAVAVFASDEKAKTGAWTVFSRPGFKPHVLWVSEPIPNDPIVVLNSFYETYPKFTHDLMYAMIEIQDEKRSTKALKEVLGEGALMPATSRHFDPVREMMKSLNIKAK